MKHILILMSSLLLIVSFQNCGADYNPGDYTDGSSTTGEVTPTPPTPPAPPAPVPLIATQSPAAVTIPENTNGQIFITVTNLTGYTVSWYKNGALVVGANTETLNFTPALLAHAGQYQARVSAAPDILLISQAINLTVTPDLNPRVYQLPSLTFNAQLYFIYAFSMNQFAINNATAFCKAQLGANATLVSYQLKAAAEPTTHYAFVTDATSCAANVYRQTYEAGFCLARLATPASLIRFQSVTCRP